MHTGSEVFVLRIHFLLPSDNLISFTSFCPPLPLPLSPPSHPSLPSSLTEPPSAPQNITVVTVTNTSVYLNWEAPSFNGGRNDAEYELSYQRTDGSESEPQIYGRVSGTEGEITGLAPFTEYTVFVSAENGVSSQATNASGRTASVTITTEEGSKSKHAHQAFVELFWKKKVM